MSVSFRSSPNVGRLAAAALVLAAACGGGGGGDPVGPDRTVARIVVTPATPNVIAGQTLTLTAQPQNAAGDAITGQTIAWSTSDQAVATVANGLVTGAKAGTATISASIGSVSGSTTVTVLPQVAQVVVTPNPADVFVGQTVKLSAALSDAAGAPITGRPVTWSSSSDAAAAVSADGTVTGKVVGQVVITASAEGRSGSATVNVRPVPVASVTVSPDPLTISFGNGGTLTATTKDAAGNTLTGRTVAWTSDNEAVATVNAVGVVTAKGVGSTTVRATSEGKVGTATVTVMGGVAVTPSSVTVEAGDTTRLSAIIKDNAGNPVTGQTVTWTTSDASKATVDGAGKVTGVSVGTATISATSGTQSGTATVTVVDTKGPELTGLLISPDTVNVRTAPATVTFSAKLTDPSGIARFDVTATSPKGTALQCRSTAPVTAAAATSASPSGTYSCSITIPAGAEAGQWSLLIGALDGTAAGNATILTSATLDTMKISPSRLTVQ